MPTPPVTEGSVAGTHLEVIALNGAGHEKGPYFVPPRATVAHVSINQGDSFSWGSAVVTVEGTIDSDLIEWNAFPTDVVLNSSTTFRMNIPVGGLIAIRMAVTTADGGADPQARAVVRFA